MNIYHLDFETTWSSSLSITKMTGLEYINHPDFRIHCMSIAKDDEPIEVINGVFVKDYLLNNTDINNNAINAFNAQFDGLVLTEYLGIKPRFYIDTLAMARAALGPQLKSYNLANVCKALGLPDKGEDLHLSKGYVGNNKLPLDIYQRIADYCKLDTFLCRAAYHMLKEFCSDEHMILIDWLTRMAVEPRLVLDMEILNNLHDDQVKSHEQIAEDLFKAYQIRPDELRSNVKFAIVLKQFGVEPPLKTSPTTGQPTYAFAKTDEGFRALLEHNNATIRRIAKARLFFKSNILETRSLSYLNVGKQTKDHRWPVGINFAGAVQTKRTSGNSAGGGNPQNLTRKSSLRNAIKAKPGYTLIVADSASIELRVCRTLCGYEDIIQAVQFKNLDLYKDFAKDIFNTDYDLVSSDQRFVGKVAELSLQYCVGTTKFDQSLKNSGINLNGDVTPHRIVSMWRQRWANVCAVWRDMDNMLDLYLNDKPEIAQTVPACVAAAAGLHYDQVKGDVPSIALPDGLLIRYPELVLTGTGKSYIWKGSSNYIYGGKVMQNWSQALANCVIQWQILELLHRRIYPELFVHDEIVIMCKHDEVDDIKQEVQTAFKTAPPWWPNLLTDVEINESEVYGEAK